MCDALNRARRYEAGFAGQIAGEERPEFHVCAPIGWINDPCGFSSYKGEIHLFFQYHPYETQWGPMHWGHVKTKDFIKWESLPPALAPDEACDGQGCFTGSALEYEGKHILLYTGVTDTRNEQDYRIIRQTQCIAVGDGKDYVKCKENPVIPSSMIPENGSREDFRDPKFWRESDGFYCLAANRNEDGNGQLLLFHSPDLKNWRFRGVLLHCKDRYGRMWECPDMFCLDGRDVLLFCAHNMLPEGMEFHPGDGTVCMVGRYDKEQCRFIYKQAAAIEYGLDFYAPQTLETADGRRIMIAWMQSWDNYLTPREFKWSGMMTVPRELRLRDGRLCQVPVRELERYYKDKVCYQDKRVAEKTQLPGVSGRVIDMTVEVLAGNYDKFYIWLAQDDFYSTEICFDRGKEVVTLDRGHAGLRRDCVTSRSMKVRSRDHQIKFRILLDRYSVELFVNDGEQALSALIYTPLKAEGISFRADGTVRINVTKHDIAVMH